MPPADRPRRKKKKKRSGVPDRWLDYSPVGRRIPGTRFIAFKVPLKPNPRVPAEASFGLTDLVDLVQRQGEELGLILDLTFTSKYYQPSDVPASIAYVKIPTPGQRVPSSAAVRSFKRAVAGFLEENMGNDRLIGVHCTHGLNRTGYLVCRYLIDVDGVEPTAAVELFNACRGHCIERSNYLHDLQGGARRSDQGAERGGARRSDQGIGRGEARRSDQGVEQGPSTNTSTSMPRPLLPPSLSTAAPEYP